MGWPAWNSVCLAGESVPAAAAVEKPLSCAVALLTDDAAELSPASAVTRLAHPEGSRQPTTKTKRRRWEPIVCFLLETGRASRDPRGSETSSPGAGVF